MANKTKKCRLGVFSILGFTLVIVAIAVIAKVILTGKSKVGNDD